MCETTTQTQLAKNIAHILPIHRCTHLCFVQYLYVRSQAASIFVTTVRAALLFAMAVGKDRYFRAFSPIRAMQDSCIVAGIAKAGSEDALCVVSKARSRRIELISVSERKAQSRGREEDPDANRIEITLPFILAGSLCPHFIIAVVFASTTEKLPGQLRHTDKGGYCLMAFCEDRPPDRGISGKVSRFSHTSCPPSP